MKDYELVYKFEKGLMTDKEKEKFLKDTKDEELWTNYMLSREDFYIDA